MSEAPPLMVQLAADLDAALVHARRLHETACRIHDETVVADETRRLDEELEAL